MQAVIHRIAVEWDDATSSVRGDLIHLKLDSPATKVTADVELTDEFRSELWGELWGDDLRCDSDSPLL